PRGAAELGDREPEVEPARRHAVQMSVLQFHRGQLEHAIGAAGPRPYAPAAMLLRCHRIFSWSETGRTAEARRDLRALAKDGFELPRDGGWLVYMSLLAAVAAGLNDRARAARPGTAGELGMEGLGATMRGLGLEAAATVGAREPADGDAVLRHEGDFWTVAYAGKAVRLRHGKGLGDIAILLANPGKEIHVADLIAASASASPDPRSGPAAELVAQGLRVSRDVSGDAVLDRRARA